MISDVGTLEIPAAVPPQAFSRRLVRAGLWNVALHSTTRVLAVVRNLALARVLAPDDFGLFAIAVLVLAALGRFSSSGIRAALIQKDSVVRQDLDTAWTIQLARGIGMAILLVVTAPYAAAFLGAPIATPFIRVLALAVLPLAFQNPATIQFERDLEFDKQYFRRIAGMLAEVVTSITAAVILRNAWALMIGLIIGNTVGAIVSYQLHPYRPRLQFSIGRAQSLAKFGQWIVLGNMLSFIAQRGDNIVVAKLLGTGALGIYAMAFSLSELATAEIGRVLADIMFPAFSRIQHSKERIVQGYGAVLELVASITLPATVVVFLLAEPFIQLALGSKWVAVAAVLPCLTAAGTLRAIARTCNAVSKGLGRPQLGFRAELIGVTISFGVMFWLARPLGLLGVAVALLIGAACMVPVAAQQLARLLDVRWRWFFPRLLPSLVLGAAVGAPVWLITTSRSDVPILAVAIPVALGAYALVAFGLWRFSHLGPIPLLLQASTASRTARAVGH